MAVTLYTKPGCPYCASARKAFIDQGVVFEEIDVYAVPGARDTLAELTQGRMVVPVIVGEDGDVQIAPDGG